MMKGQFLVPWYQIFRAGIAIVLIIVAINFCAKTFNNNYYEDNFETANELIKDVKGASQGTKYSDIFILEPNQMGVFFRGDSDSSYAAQYVDSCWKKTVTGGSNYVAWTENNPEHNCITPVRSAYLIERPVNCGLNGCFCLYNDVSTGYDQVEVVDKELDFMGLKINKYVPIDFSTFRCHNIDESPVISQEINVTKEVFVSGREETLANVTQRIINIGGTFMTPIRSEAHVFYFAYDASEDGFKVCKAENEC